MNSRIPIATMKALGFNTKSIASLRPLQPQQPKIRLLDRKVREHDRGNNTGYMERTRGNQPYQNGLLQDEEEAPRLYSIGAGRWDPGEAQQIKIEPPG